MTPRPQTRLDECDRWTHCQFNRRDFPALWTRAGWLPHRPSVPSKIPTPHPAVESGLRSSSHLIQPEQLRLIADSCPGDVLLIEQVDRLSRLTSSDWQRLRSELDARQICVVALDLPTSWMLTAPADDFTARMFGAVNSMMLDVLAAVARKDYEDRRRRQAQGQAKANAAGNDTCARVTLDDRILT
ncbi:hypothetical protein EYW49_10655 [Siculibacillus lacustris]|uniref:Resolvase/invertase-type recombinase catalytic domain-containing protein n=1 Tax=Siculibacillus lacustris TaxID=1549641 RepID=A0A4Q9VR49_9HYPH|nr:hypothetical protein EYW49_10655 [Siculibacillus lacustris]